MNLIRTHFGQKMKCRLAHKNPLNFSHLVDFSDAFSYPIILGDKFELDNIKMETAKMFQSERDISSLKKEELNSLRT